MISALILSYSFAAINVLTQCTYANRLYAAADWVSKNNRAELVHLTSFGCGLDAVSADKIREILRNSGKMYTSIKMDKISNLGAVRIRLRSMLEAVKENAGKPMCTKKIEKKTNCILMQEDRKRTLIAPYLLTFILRFFLLYLSRWVIRNVDEITSATMHHSFRPSLPDLKSQKS